MHAGRALGYRKQRGDGADLDCRVIGGADPCEVAIPKHRMIDAQQPAVFRRFIEEIGPAACRDGQLRNELFPNGV